LGPLIRSRIPTLSRLVALRRRTVRFFFYLRLRLRGIPIAYAVARPTFNVFSRLLLPTLARILTITLTFFASVNPFFVQTQLVDPLILDRPELQNRVLDLAPFPGAQTNDSSELFVIAGEATIILSPCGNHQQQICSVLLGGEVPGVRQIVAAEQWEVCGGRAHLISLHRLHPNCSW